MIERISELGAGAGAALMFQNQPHAVGGDGDSPVVRLAQTPYGLTPVLTAIAQTVSPMDFNLVQDLVCPLVRVDGPLFRYTTLAYGEGLSIPSTLIGRTGRARRVEAGASQIEAEVEDHGLEDEVPLRDIAAAMSGQSSVDPRMVATEWVSGLVVLAREKRVATLLTTRANYTAGAAGAQTLSGNSQWSDFTNSNPRQAILAARDRMLVKPNLFVCGQEVFTKLSQHPEMVESAKATGAGTSASGVINAEEMARVLQVQRVLVADAWEQTADLGQAEMFGRVWGKHAVLLRAAPLTSALDKAPSFAATFRWRRRRVRTYIDQAVGTDGAEIVHVAESLVERVRFQAAGYLFQAAVG